MEKKKKYYNITMEKKMEKNRQHNKTLNWQGGSGVPGGQAPPPDEWQAKKKRERKRRRKEGKEGRFFSPFFFCLSARILSKIRCGNNVARHKVCAVKITVILIEMHWLHIRNLYWRGVQTSA